MVVGKPRAKRDQSLKRYWRMLILKIANFLPISRFTRASMYRWAGVNIEKGIVRKFILIRFTLKTSVSVMVLELQTEYI